MSFFNTKNVVIQRVSPTAYLEIDVETSLLYYIIDPGEQLSVSSVEYKIDKLTGRDTSNVIPWTTVVIVGITDDVYQIDTTISDVLVSDDLQLTIKVTDTDGIEYYHKDNEVSPI